MLLKPHLPDAQIVDCLRREFGLTVESIEFLPIGADADTAVYQAITETLYFVKLRGGDFDEMTIVVPHFLGTQGISQMIAPIPTTMVNLDLPGPLRRHPLPIRQRSGRLQRRDERRAMGRARAGAQAHPPRRAAV